MSFDLPIVITKVVDKESRRVCKPTWVENNKPSVLGNNAPEYNKQDFHYQSRESCNECKTFERSIAVIWKMSP